MKRRSFLKSTAVAGAATLLSPGLLGLTAGCAETAGHAPAWNFDEVVDRSGTYSIKYRRAEGDRLVMWIADMDFKTDPAVSAALRERIERDVMGYTYTPDAYYDAIVGWLRTQHDYEVPREWVTACPGVIASINQAYLAFTDPGDKIIVQTPVYDPFFNYAKRLGRQVVENPLICRDGRYEMDFEGLERCFDHRTKVLVLCNPHNPIGIVWSRETLSRLAEICEHHGVLVFSDEIHGDLALFGHRQIPFCSVSPAAARIGLMFGSPTKSFNIAGLSGTAWCVIPDAARRERYKEALSSRKLSEFSVMSMVATMAAYTHEPLWLRDLKKYLEGNVTLLEERMAAAPATRMIRVIRPEASFLVWLDCREMGLPQDELMAYFNDKAKIAVNNGASYGTGGEGFVRLNIGCPRSIVAEAHRRLELAGSQMQTIE